MRKLVALCPVGALGGISLSVMPRFLPQVFAPDPEKIGRLFREVGHISSTPAMERVIPFIGQNLRLKNGLVIFWPRKLSTDEPARIMPGAGHFLAGATAELVKELLPDRS